MIICDFETLNISFSFSRIGTSYTVLLLQFFMRKTSRNLVNIFFLVHSLCNPRPAILTVRLLSTSRLSHNLFTGPATPARKFFAQIFLLDEENLPTSPD